MRQLLLTITFLGTALCSNAQELNCQVQVILGQNAQVGQVDPKTFEEMENTVVEFMNNTRWTNDVFKFEERIECNIQITINNVISVDEFSGSIQVTARRPMYNSSFYSTLINYNDQDFRIRYVRNARIQFQPDRFTDNLTSILAFYAFMIIGYDYDSYSLEGGTPYFIKAQQIVTNAQNAAEPGWKAFEGNRNRYFLVDNALHQIFKPLRRCYYQYHRLGFDILYSDVEKGRQIVLSTLEQLKPIQRNRPASVNIQMFFTSKLDELSGLFSEAPTNQKNQAVQLFKFLDPANGTRYDEILKN